MPCLILILFATFPRIALVLLFFFSNYLQRAYHGLLLPLLGFIFLPLTTLVYAWIVNSGLPLAGINLVILIIAVIVDLGAGAAANTIVAGAGPTDPFAQGPIRYITGNLRRTRPSTTYPAMPCVSTEVHSLTWMEAHPKSDVEEES